MPYEMILVETRGRVGLITLNRPQAMNALNNQLMREVMDALDSFDRDDAVGAMVIAGSEKAFAAGADIKEMSGRSAQEMTEADHVAVFGRIRSVEKPVIAAVSGWALGGGCEIALSCDMIVASESAKFGQPEITIGVIPGAGGTQRLPRAVEQLRVNPDTPVSELLNPAAAKVAEEQPQISQPVKDELAGLVQLCFPDMPRVSAEALVEADVMDIALQTAHVHQLLFQSDHLRTDFVLLVVYGLMRGSLEHLEEMIKQAPAIQQALLQSDLPWKPNEWRK